MHDVREEPLDIPHRGPQDRVRYIQVASRAQSALFRPTNAQATVHCLFYTTSPSYWAAPPKSQWIMELYSYLHAHASVLTVTREYKVIQKVAV